MESNLDDKLHVLLRRVSAIVFCGCPHRGADAASWGLLASRMVAFALADANSRLLSDLEVDSEILDLINEDFLTTLEHDHANLEKIVDNFSSKIGLPKFEIYETIDADHREMVKEPGVKDISSVLRGLEERVKQHEAQHPCT